MSSMSDLTLHRSTYVRNPNEVVRNLNRLSVRLFSSTPGAGSSAWYTQLRILREAEERPVRIDREKYRKAAGSNPARSTTLTVTPVGSGIETV